jgi:hypothetical protein
MVAIMILIVTAVTGEIYMKLFERKLCSDHTIENYFKQLSGM